MSWQPFVISLCAGLVVGVAYGLFSVRSPAPPVIALLGLLGMLLGETAVSWVRGHTELIANVFHLKTFDVSQPVEPTERAEETST